jgi:hypothetical protein
MAPVANFYSVNEIEFVSHSPGLSDLVQTHFDDPRTWAASREDEASSKLVSASQALRLMAA